MSKNKTSNYKKFANNYDNIDWTKRVKKKFKTSWGAEYTLYIKESLLKNDDTPTIDEMMDKNRGNKK